MSAIKLLRQRNKEEAELIEEIKKLEKIQHDGYHGGARIPDLAETISHKKERLLTFQSAKPELQGKAKEAQITIQHELPALSDAFQAEISHVIECANRLDQTWQIMDETNSQLQDHLTKLQSIVTKKNVLCADDRYHIAQLTAIYFNFTNWKIHRNVIRNNLARFKAEYEQLQKDGLVKIGGKQN